MPEDTDNILYEAALSAVTKAVDDMPVLPHDHPDVVEFRECWDKLHAIAVRNGWLLCMSMLRQTLNADGEQCTSQGTATTISVERLAKNFAQFGMPGGLAAEVYSRAVQNINKFHSEIVPALFDAGRKG